MNSVQICRELSVEYEATGNCSLVVETDIPGGLAQRASFTLPAAGRGVARLRLPGTVRGRIMRIALVPTAGLCRLYVVAVMVKPLNQMAAWRPKPFVVAPETEWLEARLPIEPTPESWQQAGLPIEPTADGWEQAALPIEPSEGSFREYQFANSPPPDWDWLDLPVGEEVLRG